MVNLWSCFICVDFKTVGITMYQPCIYGVVLFYCHDESSKNSIELNQMHSLRNKLLY
jgi:hypothetical protein